MNFELLARSIYQGYGPWSDSLRIFKLPPRNRLAVRCNVQQRSGDAQRRHLESVRDVRGRFLPRLALGC